MKTAVTPWTVRALALLLGAVNHAVFVAAIASMGWGLWTGLAMGRGTWQGWPAVVANLFLVLQFPLLHSHLLGRRGGRWLARLFPAPYGGALVTTTYASIASLQLLATFWLWSPGGVVLWQPAGWGFALHAAAFGTSWLFLLKAIRDGGIAVQTGALGWWAVVRGQPPRYPTFATHGAFALCRQPIYLAFTLLLWTAPAWTADRILLAAVWTAYCVVAPRRKEQRYVARHGDAYRAYQRRVAYFLPLPLRRP